MAIFKHTNKVLLEICRAVPSLPARTVYLIEGEATICTSKEQMTRLADAQLNMPSKRVAEFTDADINYIKQNYQRLFDKSTGNAETYRWLESKFKDIFSKSAIEVEDIKQKSEGEANVAELEKLISGMDNKAEKPKASVANEVAEVADVVATEMVKKPTGRPKTAKTV